MYTFLVKYLYNVTLYAFCFIHERRSTSVSHIDLDALMWYFLLPMLIVDAFCL